MSKKEGPQRQNQAELTAIEDLITKGFCKDNLRNLSCIPECATASANLQTQLISCTRTLAWAALLYFLNIPSAPLTVWQENAYTRQALLNKKQLH